MDHASLARGALAPAGHPLERIEIAAWADLYRAAPPVARAALGLEVAEGPGGAVVFRAPGADVLALNRVLGLRGAPVGSRAAVAAVREAYRRAGVPRFFVQVAPGEGAAALEGALAAEGLRRHNRWRKLARAAAPEAGTRLPAASSPAASAADDGLAVREIGRDRATAFGDLVAEAFGWPQAADWVAATVGRPGWRHWLAFDGSRAVGTGAVFAAGGEAWLDLAATRASHRGRGVQRRLLERRAAAAARAGARQLVLETAEELPDRPAPAWRNARRQGFDRGWPRPNWIG